MEKTENIYIDALKFGMTKMQTGITFNKLINHLTNSMGWTIEGEFLKYFRFWFHTNFFNPENHLRIKNGIDANSQSLIDSLHAFDDYSFCMTSNAYEFLMDYEKLQQTRQDSRKAHKLALWAIGISIAVGLSQIIFDIFFNK